MAASSLAAVLVTRYASHRLTCNTPSFHVEGQAQVCNKFPSKIQVYDSVRTDTTYTVILINLRLLYWLKVTAEVRTTFRASTANLS